MSAFARVAVPRPLYQTFLYRIPADLVEYVQPGRRVVVPFGRRRLIGWVDELTPAPEVPPANVREILQVPDPEPVLDAELLELCRWVASYYAAPIGMVYRSALPASLSAEAAEGGTPDVTPPLRTRQVVSIRRELLSLRERDQLFGRARRQRELFEYLETVGGSAEIAHLAHQLRFSRSVVHGLADKGLAEIHDELRDDLFESIPVAQEPHHTPTVAQAEVLERLIDAARRPTAGTFVLRGVTGSGKTLVYIELLRELVTRRNRGAILLVPEISLTPQTLSRFRSAFGDEVALLHSALSDGERYAAWASLRRGDKRIVIGARSAVFAPVRDLGAIIIDEEHESSYKQNDPSPRYHAREVAVVRCRHAGAICLLGSATPSLESWANAQTGKWGSLELPERIGQRPMPGVEVVDLREARSARAAQGDGRPLGPLVLSSPLRQAIQQRLAAGQQSILLLNRRGYSTFVQCRECGSVSVCGQCNVSLTEHLHPPRLVCHHCNHQEPIPVACSECGSQDLSHRGVGTEQVERVLGEAFPAARLARMDVDTTSGKWSHHEILGRVGRQEVDILLGTQMIAKGLDFPNVTLVGVINADVGLSLPDFRASERSFQLLTQVAGRAGRGPAGGEVIIQTALPGHYAIRFALDHDYPGFAARELEERSGPGYPPNSRLANLIVSGKDEGRVQQAAEAARGWLDGLFAARSIPGIDLVGPAPCPIDRVRGRWRWHLLLKARDPESLGNVLRYFATRFEPPAAGLRVEIDRDPASLL
ncbi:MAG TPA: primosomal protein N' [Gemmatimonadota bacterium]|nr:primosomal protein N' [Gemmatimonadota bacterium]